MRTIDELHAHNAETITPDDMAQHSDAARRRAYAVACRQRLLNAETRYDNAHRAAYAILEALQSGSDPYAPAGGALVADYLRAIASNLYDLSSAAFSQYLRLDVPAGDRAAAEANLLVSGIARDMAEITATAAEDYRRAYPAKDGAA